MLCFFQYFNYLYLVLFRGNLDYVLEVISPVLNENEEPVMENGEVVMQTTYEIRDFIWDFSNYDFPLLLPLTPSKTGDARINELKENLETYRSLQLLSLVCAASLIYQLVIKLVYNTFADKKVPIDRWTIMDAFMAVMYIIAVNLVASFDYKFFMDKYAKDNLDNFMVVIMVISWARFFFYFLMIKEISKLLLTIVAMIGSTFSFLIFLGCYFLLMASIFTTLYQDIKPKFYEGLFFTIRTLYDGMIASYDYKWAKEYEITISIMTMIHVFLANIMLVNYLVAILSTTYEKM